MIQLLDHFLGPVRWDGAVPMVHQLACVQFDPGGPLLFAQFVCLQPIKVLVPAPGLVTLWRPPCSMEGALLEYSSLAGTCSFIALLPFVLVEVQPADRCAVFERSFG